MNRRLRMGLVTVLGLAKRGYFIPHRYAAHTAPSDESTAYTALGQMFEAARPGSVVAREGMVLRPGQPDPAGV